VTKRNQQLTKLLKELQQRTQYEHIEAWLVEPNAAVEKVEYEMTWSLLTKMEGLFRV